MKKLLFFLLAIVLAFQVYAQNVQIGSGTSTQYFIPIRAYYGYTYSQQIIKSSEISASGTVTTGGTISKIRYYWDGSGDFSNSTQWKVYLGHTTKTSFLSSTDWVADTNLTTVFDSLITPPTSAGWFTIILQTPFVYNGTDNLILAVDENTPSYSNNDASFLSYSSTDCGLYYFEDYTNPNPSTPPSGTKTSSVSQVKLYFQEACATPENLNIATLNSNDVTVNWINGAFETQWNIQYKLTSDAVWTPINSISTKPYQITGLTPNSTYQIQVQSNCGSSVVSNWSDTLVFTTPAIATQLPFTSNFENTADNSNWQFINGTQVNKWFVGNAIDPITGLAVDTLGTSGSLYISRNANGDTNIYSGGSTSNSSKVYAFRDFFIPSGATEVNLEFDWRANGNAATYDFLRVYLVPTTATITAGAIPPSGLDISAQIGNYAGGVGEHWLSKKTNWQHAKFRITSTQFPNLGNNTWRLLIHWRNESTSGTMQPPAAVDNMTMNVITCSAPTALVSSNATINSVDLSWTETGTATAWNIFYKDVSSSIWSMTSATSNPFTLTNLNSSTPYQVKVQSNCGSDTSYASSESIFYTTCGTITSFPWNEGFEVDWTPAGNMGNSSSPYCWTNVNKGSGSSNYWQRNTSTVHSGSGSAAMYTDNSFQNNDWLITPIIALTGNQRLRFWAMNNSSNTYGELDEISIWVNNTTTLDTTGMGTYDSIPGFVKVFQTIIPDGPWAQYEVNLSQFIGNSHIAFVRKYTPNDGWNLRLDDVEVSNMPTCTKPDSLVVSNVLTNSADISWYDNNTANTLWNLYYKKSTDAAFTMVQVTSSPYTLTPIDPSTTYQVYIKTLCGAIESEATIIKTFITPCVPINALTALPWTEGFEGITATNELPNCWLATNLGTNTYTQTSDYGSYNRIAHSGTKSAYFDWGCNDYFYTPGFDLVAGTTYTFSYWYITDGESGWTTLKAGAYSAQNTTSFIQNVGNPVSNAVNTTYQQYVGTFTPTTNGVYYFGVNCQSTSNPWYLTVDDFRLEILNCSMPTNLTANNPTPTSFDAVWDAGTATSWQIEYKIDTATTWTKQMVSADSLNISGLTPNTNYQVRVAALCNGAVDTSLFATMNVLTPCLAITTLPYLETFDNYGTYSYSSWNNCWYRTSTYSPGSYPYIAGTNFSSPGSVYFYVSSGVNYYNLVCAPSIDPTIPINTLRVKFKMYNYSTSIPGVKVGVMSNPNDTSTFVQIGSIIGLTASSTWEDKEVSFASYTGTGTYIAFKCEGTATSSNSFNIDNVEISVIPTCAKPTNLTISNITTTAAELSWTNGNPTNSSWWLYTKLISATNYDSVLINMASPYQIQNLLPSSGYNYYMKTNCTTDVSEPTSVYSFYTACAPISSFPWIEGFESTWLPMMGVSNSPQPTNCWININGGASTSYLWRKANSTGIPAYQRTGTGSAQLYAYNNAMGDYLITPTFTLNGNQKIVFWAKGYSTSYGTYPENLWVKAFDETTNGALDAVSDTTLMTNIGFINDTNQFTWKEYEFPLTGLVGNYRLVFARDNNVGYYFHI
ncbi:MAG: type sorting protein, partial [Bacteroidetes bacterium]|nr:type sorting protein [Bacteroidota bacterium]